MESALDESMNTLSNQEPVEGNWPHPKRICLEILGITMLVLGLCFWAETTTPHFMQNYFHWLLLLPILFGLCYGPYYGTCCAGVVTFAVAATWVLPTEHWVELPANHLFGLVASGLLTDELVRIWQRRVYRLVTEYQTQKTRFAQFARDYHLLRMSHARLEQTFIGSTTSFRRSLLLLGMQLQNVELSDPADRQRAAAAILEVFRDWGKLQTAALHWNPIGEFPENEAAASLGRVPTLDTKHSLVQAALRTRRLVTVDKDSLVDMAGLLAVIPLVDTTDRVWGIVAVYEVPYFAVKNKLLDGLGLLGGHVGDILNRATSNYSDPETAIASIKGALNRCLNDLTQGGVPSSLVRLQMRSPEMATQIAEVLATRGRSIDKRWTFSLNESESMIFLLLPITAVDGATRLAQRIRKAVDTNTETIESYSGLNISVYLLKVSDQPQGVIASLAPQLVDMVNDSKRIPSLGLQTDNRLVSATSPERIDGFLTPFRDISSNV